MVVSKSERGERGFGLRNESGEGLCVVRESERDVTKKNKKNRLKK
jgi:hypothetical protein